jgi:hypothetical protein
MKREIKSSARSSSGAAFIMCLFAGIAAFAASGRCGFAADEFQDLINKVPRSANSVVLLNMEKAKNSPMGLKENWSAKIDKAFEDGLVSVPPQAKRFVLASQIDFEFMEPLWEAAVIETEEDLSPMQIQEARYGAIDSIEGLPAIARPNDTYLVKLGPKLIGAMGPANRQVVVRWIRDVSKSSPPPLSPYLQKAAVYSDKAGSEIIMAIDLDGVFSPNRIAKYLKSKQKELKAWGADADALAELLGTVQGFRLGVRIGEEPSAMIAIDVSGDASKISSFAKPLLLQALSDKGAMMDDFQSWTAKAEGHVISLSGKLSKSGLRRLMSVVDSPAAENDAAPAAKPAQPSPGEQPNSEKEASLKYFRSVTAMASELRLDMGSSKNLASTSFWFDKYARRIERSSILNVNEDLINYGAFVAQQLRQASLAVKTMGIESGARQAQVTSSGGGYSGDYGDYGGYRYGAYGRYTPAIANRAQTAEIKAVGAERRAIRAEEKGIAATDVQQIRQAIIAATADIRRKMTEKYQVQF